MAVEKIQDEGQTLSTPTGKMLGIVDTRADYEQLVPVLTAAGFNKLELLLGEDGIHLLERVHTFFFSDMEDRVIKRHLEELKKGHAVIAIETPSNRATELAKIASEHGARDLVHFGMLAVTVHT